MITLNINNQYFYQTLKQHKKLKKRFKHIYNPNLPYKDKYGIATTITKDNMIIKYRTSVYNIKDTIGNKVTIVLDDLEQLKDSTITFNNETHILRDLISLTLFTSDTEWFAPSYPYKSIPLEENSCLDVDKINGKLRVVIILFNEMDSLCNNTSKYTWTTKP